MQITSIGKMVNAALRSVNRFEKKPAAPENHRLQAMATHTSYLPGKIRTALTVTVVKLANQAEQQAFHGTTPRDYGSTGMTIRR